MGEDLREHYRWRKRSIKGDYQQYGLRHKYFWIGCNTDLSLTEDNWLWFYQVIWVVRATCRRQFDNTDELQSFFGRINYSLSQ